jgi:leucyl aminopeptidase
MSLSVQLKSLVPSQASLKSLAADLIVVAVPLLGGGKSATGRAKEGRKDASVDSEPALAALDALLLKSVRGQVTRDEFTGKRDQSMTFTTLGRMKAPRVVVVGLGDVKQWGASEPRTFAAKMARLALSEKAKHVAILLPAGLESHLRAIGEGIAIGSYRFTKYLSGDRKPKVELEKVYLAPSFSVSTAEKRALTTGLAIGDAINLTRTLGNEPPNVITPAGLADAAVEMATKHGIRAKVFDFKEIKRQGMKLIQAVGQGSVNEPRFVHLSYEPPARGSSKRKTAEADTASRQRPARIVFIGKGITFDSGGISIKPAAGMGEMKTDMSGAGNMVGLMAAVAALAPRVEVHAILTCAENMPDGGAYRPGDIWPSLDGKTVEIVNTDAEGRLLLADALAYARQLEPDLLVDNATLTGACVVALGPTCSAFYATTEEAGQAFAAAVKASGETMWRMPLLEDLRDQLKSDVADVKQAGDRFGGSITAALFLREFIGTTKHWVHVDIAGPALLDRAVGWSTKGASGHGILTNLALVEAAERGEIPRAPAPKGSSDVRPSRR